MDKFKAFWSEQLSHSELVQIITSFWQNRTKREKTILSSIILVSIFSFTAYQAWDFIMVYEENQESTVSYNFDYDIVRNQLIELNNLQKDGLSYIEPNEFESIIRSVASRYRVSVQVTPSNQDEANGIALDISWVGDISAVLATLDDLHNQGVIISSANLNSETGQMNSTVMLSYSF